MDSATWDRILFVAKHLHEAPRPVILTIKGPYPPKSCMFQNCIHSMPHICIILADSKIDPLRGEETRLLEKQLRS